MRSSLTDPQALLIRPLSPNKRWHQAFYHCAFRLRRNRDAFLLEYTTFIGTPSLAGLTVAPGLTIPWPHPAYRLYGEYLATSGLSPRPPRRHAKAYDLIDLWYEPYMFLWNSWLHMDWQSCERWSVFTDADSTVAHLSFRPHGYHHHGAWTPNANDPIWVPSNMPRLIVDFWPDASRIFDSFNGVDSLPVGEWLATWGPRVSHIFQVQWTISAFRRIILLTVMLMATGLVTLEYSDPDYAETELARQYAITEEAQKWR